MWYGEGLREHVWMHAGDFLYIPANTPHLPYNPSESAPCVGVMRAPIPMSKRASRCWSSPIPELQGGEAKRGKRRDELDRRAGR